MILKMLLTLIKLIYFISAPIFMKYIDLNIYNSRDSGGHRNKELAIHLQMRDNNSLSLPFVIATTPNPLVLTLTPYHSIRSRA